MSRLAVVSLVLFISAGSAACKHPGASSPDAGGAVPDASAAGAAAATQTATSNAACTAIAPFYWEIGDSAGAIVSGSVDKNGAHVAADQQMDIASASKLVFGAYVVEKYKDDVTQIDHRAMTMQSGYHSLTYTSCTSATTVADCLAKSGNDTLTAADVDHFFYNGGHFQHYAASTALGLGGDDDAALEAALGLPYSSPQLAAGVHTSASAYAAFLRKILRGELAIHDHLGEDPVCTLPGASCPTAIYSPAAPYAWHYSWGHWVEDDAGDDGAFSSPGAFGFYPWIDATRTYYGVVARQVLDGYKQSAACGRLIRRAFETGTPQ